MNGFNTATLELFRRHTDRTPPTDGFDDPPTLDYNYSTTVLTEDGTINTGPFNGWHREPPTVGTGAGEVGEYIFAIVVHVADRNEIEQNIPGTSWSEPALVGLPGDDGDPGESSFSVVTDARQVISVNDTSYTVRVLAAYLGDDDILSSLLETDVCWVRINSDNTETLLTTGKSATFTPAELGFENSTDVSSQPIVIKVAQATLNALR